MFLVQVRLQLRFAHARSAQLVPCRCASVAARPCTCCQCLQKSECDNLGCLPMYLMILYTTERQKGRLIAYFYTVSTTLCRCRAHVYPLNVRTELKSRSHELPRVSRIVHEMSGPYSCVCRSLDCIELIDPLLPIYSGFFSTQR